MAKKKDSKSKASAPARNQIKDTGGAAQDVARTSARSTVSGPAAKNGYQDVTDDATAKVAGTEAMAAAMPFNAAKPSEYGEASSEPAVGQSVDPPHPDRRCEHAVGVQRIRESRQRQSADELQSRQRAARPRACRFSRSRADDQPGRARRRQPEFAQGRAARADAARRLHPARKDHALRSRAHSRAHRACARLGCAWLFRVLRAARPS